MNKFNGEITNISKENLISFFEIKVGDVFFKSIVLDSDSKSSYLNLGNNVNVLFKETEVILANSNLDGISLQNKIEAEIIGIKKGTLISEINLNNKIGKFSSIITTSAVDKLNLKIGQNVFAFIKTNEVMLAK